MATVVHGLQVEAFHGEQGSRESIHMAPGPLDARGRPLKEAMPPRSTERSDGPQRPC